MRFRNKVILGFLILIAANALALSLICRLFLEPVFINDSKKRMEEYGQQVAEVLDKDEDSIMDLITEVNVDYYIQVYVIDSDRDILYTHLGDNASAGKRTRKRIEKAIGEYKASGKEAYIGEYYDEFDEYLRLYYVRQTKDGRYIIMSKSIRGIEQDISVMTKFIYITLFALALCFLVLWIIITYNFTKRLESMSRVTKKMSGLDFGEKVNYRGKDEIGILAESIDDMSDKLEQSIDRMRGELDRRKELIRNISHELRTPITSIRGYAEQMQTIYEGDEKAERYCGIIVEECDAMDTLSGEMLEMSSLEDSEGIYEKTELDTGDFFERFKLRIDREFSSHLIETVYQNRRIVGNEYLLERALFNFLANAVKYGTPGEPIRLEGYEENGRYVFAVTNSGKEIPPAEREKIWDAFYKTDKSRKRSGSYGIGLSIVRRIAIMHGGYTAVDCREGRTVFSLWIPLIS